MAKNTIKSKKWKMVLRPLFVFLILPFFALVSIQCQSTHSPLTPPPSDEVTVQSTDSAEQNNETVIQPAETQQESLPPSCEAQKRNKSKLESGRDNAIEWLDERATRAPREKVIEYIDFVSENVDPRYQLVVLAILTIESEGDPKAKSADGSLGITQILPRCWEKELKAQGIIKCRQDFFDYRKNILACQYILQKHAVGGRSLKRILIKYNRSNKYVCRVISRMENLKKAL